MKVFKENDKLLHKVLNYVEFATLSFVINKMLKKIKELRKR